MKRRENKGFTLAELLVVVAIIGVLVAVAIPVFSGSLEKAKLAADHAAVRDIYAVIQIANNTKEVTYLDKSGEMVTKSFAELEAMNPVPPFWGSEDGSYLIEVDSSNYDKTYRFKADGTVGNNPCPVCEQWNSTLQDRNQCGMSHIKGNYINVSLHQGSLMLVTDY